MKLTINNFGPVRGKQNYIIDLNKEFSLITGGNGLGKTYLGYILYGLIKRFKAPMPNVLLDFIFNNSIITENISRNIISIEISSSNLQDCINKIIESYKNNIHIYMGIDRKSADMLLKDLSIDIENIEEIYEYFKTKGFKRKVVINGEETISFNTEKDSTLITASSSEIDLFEDKSTQEMVLKFAGIFIKDILAAKLFINKVYYIPVERNSLYTFSKELSLKRSEMIEHMQSFLLEENKDKDVPEYLRKNANRYPEAIEDALRQAQDLNQLTKNEADKDYIGIAEEIEKDILQGAINVNAEGEVEFLPESNNGKKVPVHLSASFIKTISSIVFFLKHIATKGDMLLIDEPEMNLHPTMQIAFARILAKISNSGIKIWMSTHSDYIISELNNMCLVGALNKKGLNDKTKKWGYFGNYFLDKDKMQALYLNGAKYKTQVKIENLEIKDYGVDIRSIDTCLDNLNERTNELFEIYENLD